MTLPAQIFIQGAWNNHPKQARVYEKTSTTFEVVGGRIAMEGSSTGQLKLCDGTANAIGIFNRQQSIPGLETTGYTYDDSYAWDGKIVQYEERGSMPVFQGVLLDGESVVQGDYLDCTTGGVLIKHAAGGRPVARALETAAPSGADDDDFLAEWIGATPVMGSLYGAVVTTESVTISSNTGILTNTPLLIEYIEITSGTGPLVETNVSEETVTVSTNTGALASVPYDIIYIDRTAGTDTGPTIWGNIDNVADANKIATGECCIDWDTGEITFNATDAVTQAKIRYKTGAYGTALKEVVTDTTPLDGECTVNYTTKILTCNASNQVATLSVRYWYAGT